MRSLWIFLIILLVGCGQEQATDFSAQLQDPIEQKQSKEISENNAEELTLEVPYHFWYHNQVLILNYNHISEDHLSSHTISPEYFREHMKFLKENDFHPLKLEEFYEFIDKGKLSYENAVLITFGDGYESFYHEAYPVLKELEFPSTCFVINERIRDSLERKRENMIPPLTLVQIEELKNSGLVSFESHTYGLHEFDNEENQPTIAKKEDQGEQEYRSKLYVDFMMSRSALEGITQKPVLGLSYPYSYYNDQLLRVLKKAGYRYGFVSGTGMTDVTTNPYLLPKNDVGAPEVDGTQFEQKIRSIIIRSKGM